MRGCIFVLVLLCAGPLMAQCPGGSCAVPRKAVSAPVKVVARIASRRPARRVLGRIAARRPVRRCLGRLFCR